MTRAAPEPMSALPSTLLPTLPDDVGALQALLRAAWTERDSVAAERDALAEQNDRLRHLLLRLKRLQFGARSERLPEAQLQLGLEDVETAIAMGEVEAEQRNPGLRKERTAKRRASRGALPSHLPRVEVTLAPEDTTCPCCRAAMTVIGHNTAERLDVIEVAPVRWTPRSFRERCCPWPRHIFRMRLSSGGRWSSWCARGVIRRTWLVSSSRHPRRSATGWRKPIGRRAAGKVNPPRPPTAS